MPGHFSAASVVLGLVVACGALAAALSPPRLAFHAASSSFATPTTASLKHVHPVRLVISGTRSPYVHTAPAPSVPGPTIPLAASSESTTAAYLVLAATAVMALVLLVKRMHAEARRGAPSGPSTWVLAAATGALDRRSLLVGTVAGAILTARGPALADDLAAVSVAPPPVQKTVLITGCNSGIGLDGATKLARKGYRVILACRDLDKANAARASILGDSPAVSPDNLIPVACDLASLASVRTAAAAVRGLGVPLDVVVLNAGVQFTGAKEVPRTKDGFELTVGTNHFGHFLLMNLLLPSVAPNGRIVVTASEVHDPKSPGGAVGLGASLGDLQGLIAHPDGRFDSLDGGPYDAEKAYKDSKLCNILFARELQRRLEAEGSAISVVMFGPGLITRTGFFRSQPPLFIKLFDFATNDLLHVAETVSGGGDCLTYMVETDGLPKGVFYNNNLDFDHGFGKHLFAETLVSEEAMDAEKGRRLWDLSARLVGLPA